MSTVYSATNKSCGGSAECDDPAKRSKRMQHRIELLASLLTTSSNGDMDTHDDVPDALPPSYAASITAPLSAPSQPLQATASPLFDHQHGAQNLPSGFFLLRNRAHNRTLDMVGHRTNEGAEVRSCCSGTGERRCVLLAWPARDI